MKVHVIRFLKDPAGAITADWVVLTAAIIGLGMVVLAPIAFSADGSAQGVSSYIGNFDVGYENQ